MNLRFYYLITIFCFTQSIAFSQESNTFVYGERANKNQIGIGINRFVNSIFPADNNSFLVEYRYAKTNAIHYRAGANYNYNSAKEDGHLNLGIKTGIDKVFLQQKNWSFYYGIDIGGSYNYYKGSLRHIGDTFVSPFLGIMYQFSKNFSISTEPNLYYKLNFIIDNGTFEANNKKIWGESGFGKIGYIQLNFHF